MAAILEVDYFNAFWTKRMHTGQPCGYVTGLGGSGPIAPNQPDLYQSTGTFPGPVSFGDVITGLQNQNTVGKFGPVPALIPAQEDAWPAYYNQAERQKLRESFYIEDSRIRGGYGNTQVNLGVRAYLNEENPVSQHRFASLIYSGPYSSLTGYNETNVFSIGESITKSVDPAFRSIQKLYADDTNLLILQENKTSYALIDKDAIYSAEGSGTVTSTELVIGQVVPYLGEYGISQNPESFAKFGFQKYFVDKDRSAVMRLSRDGLTEISSYGMVDYFRDQLAEIDNSFKLYCTDATLVAGITDLTVFDVSDPDHSLELGAIIYTTPDGLNYSSTGATVVKIEDLTGGVFRITASSALTLLSPGGVTSLTITIGGAGYPLAGAADAMSNIPPVSGVGVGLTTDWTANPVAPNEILTITVNNAGSGYVTGDTVTITTDYGQSIWAEIVVAATPLVNGIRFCSYKRGRIKGGYDIYSKHYIVSMQTIPAYYDASPNTFQTLSFDEQINGWVSRYSYKPTDLGSLENTYYTVDNYKLYKQFDNTVENRRGYFYENAYSPSLVTFFSNGEPTTSKVFHTVSYEGSSGWEVTTFEGDLEGEDFRGLNGPLELYEQYQDQTAIVYSYLEGRYEINAPVNTGINATFPPYSYAGFNRKENKYVASLVQEIIDINASSTYPPRPGEVVFGNSMSGIKGFYATITMSTDDVTEVGGEKELFSVSSNVVKSS